MTPRAVNVVLGVWLMAAPAVLAHAGSASPAAEIDRTIGPIVASAAIIAMWPEVRPVRWVNVVLGVVLVLAPLVAPLWQPYEPAAAVNSVLVGGVMSGTALIRGPVRSRFGGGWRVVWRGQGRDQAG